jgi:hypothetical protein
MHPKRGTSAGRPGLDYASPSTRLTAPYVESVSRAHAYPVVLAWGKQYSTSTSACPARAFARGPREMVRASAIGRKLGREGARAGGARRVSEKRPAARGCGCRGCRSIVEEFEDAPPSEELYVHTLRCELDMVAEWRTLRSVGRSVRASELHLAVHVG